MGGLIVLALAGVALPWLAPARPGEVRGRGIKVVSDRLSRLGARRGRSGRDDAALIGAALTSVAARLRAGQSPAAAWTEVAATLPAHLAATIRTLAEGAVAPGDDRFAPGGVFDGAVAATRLARELGAELAPVLEACAAGVEESARARAERAAALAAPQATAKVLLALPLVGIAVGALVGARPWQLFTTTIWGGGLLLGAAVFVGLGRWWISALIGRASRAGEDAP